MLNPHFRGFFMPLLHRVNTFLSTYMENENLSCTFAVEI